jgi:hypothetical protein
MADTDVREWLEDEIADPIPRFALGRHLCQTRWERGNEGADQQYNPQRDIKGEP